jgi:hypothetical protein
MIGKRITMTFVTPGPTKVKVSSCYDGKAAGKFCRKSP